MSRLTTRKAGIYVFDNISKTEDEYIEKENQMVQKFGRLEDIEEELGIDFDILFKALDYGVWLKNGNKLEHHRVFLCKCNGAWALGYDWDYKYGLQGWCLETRKYKQHWALTKEDLE